MSSIYIHEFPGVQRRFSLVPPDDTDELEAAQTAIEGICALADGLFEPLALELELLVRDSETLAIRNQPNLPRRWLLVRDRLPPGVETVDNPEDFVRVTREVLTAAAMTEFVTDAFAQPLAAPDLMLTWETMTLRTTCARLPAAIAEQTIAVEHGAGTITHPVEGRDDGSWVYGPLGNTLVAPIDLMVLNASGELTLTLSVHWSLWSLPNSPGHPQVARAVERLLARGWTEEQRCS